MSALGERQIAMTHVSELIGMAAQISGVQTDGQPSQIVELKAVDALLPVHRAQILTYMRLANCEVGLLINFNVEQLTKGIERFAL